MEGSWMDWVEVDCLSVHRIFIYKNTLFASLFLSLVQTCKRDASCQMLLIHIAKLYLVFSNKDTNKY